MDHFVEKLEIKNFKSIRDLTLTDFRRINLFIGRPNVGKSNLLEALGMFSFSVYDPYKLVDKIKLSEILRIEKPSMLFFDGNLKDEIQISSTQVNTSRFRLNSSIEDVLQFTFSDDYSKEENDDHPVESASFYYDSSLKYLGGNYPSNLSKLFKKYIFNNNSILSDSAGFFLSPPFGDNLMDVLENHPELRKTISSWFKDYNLRLVLDRTSNSLKIQKEVGDNEVFILPYSMIADTLQRLIFYKTAVASNQNSVLIFEEPEAHAFPPYITEFTQEVIKSETNQFFIATHSPIVVNDLLENAREDLSIFISDFKDGQTVARALTREELEEVYDYGIDLFFNNEAYVV